MIDSLAPYQNHSMTSFAAALAIEPFMNLLQRRVLNYIRACAERGATDLELESALDLIGSTIRPRRCELREYGMVVDSGHTRPTASGRQAVVWIAVEFYIFT